MIKVAITPEMPFEGEAQWMVDILDAGWNRVHLRHPGATLKDMQTLIESIPQRYHSRLRLHGHFELTNMFNLGGIHLNHRCPKAPENYTGAMSKSFHSLEEIDECPAATYDYVTISPVFPSMSKPGYGPKLSLDSISQHIKKANTPVLALGGVNAERLWAISRCGFDGYAVLGDLSETHGELLKNKLKEYN